MSDKLHDAAIRAAEKWAVLYDLRLFQQKLLAEAIRAAIADHLKSEGWEELREAAEEAKEWIGSSPHTMREITASNFFRLQVKEALRRVRGLR